MINRRTFMVYVGTTSLLLTLPRFSFPAERLVRIVTYIPRRIFFSARLPDVPVLLNSIKLNDKDKTVSIFFSNGQTIQFDLNSSSVNIVHKNKVQYPTRQSVLLRSLAAWVIDAVWQSLHNKRNPKTIYQLRDNFEYFQRSSILETVTPDSLYNLVRNTFLLNQITFVGWNRQKLQFEVK